MIEVSDLKKSYGSVEALRGVSFAIQPGQIVGLLGPNGAGKTTIIKIITGFLQPDVGSVVVDGLDVLTHTRAVQARIGYLPENAPLYPELSVQSYLKMIAELRQLPEAEQAAHISDAVLATGLAALLERPIGQLFKGFRQRVAMAQAILHKTKPLIFDESIVGLDPTQTVDTRRLIPLRARHATILFSTHILSEVEALCDRAIILINGQVRADNRLADLEETADAVLVLAQKTDGVERELRSLSGVRGIEPAQAAGGYPLYRVYGMGDVDLCPAIYDLARRGNWPLRELRRDVRTLETVFNQLATGG